MRGVDTLGYVGFLARDIAGWKRFAQQVLGLQLADELDDGTLVLRADGHRRRIMIHPSDRDEVAYVGWECRSPHDLDNVRQALRSGGIAFEDVSPQDAARSAVKAMIRFRDADDFLIEAYYGPTLLAHQPFVSPVGGRPFVMGEQGLGHVVLMTANYREQVAFYEDILSFRITDYLEISGINREATFLRVNQRHHSLALVDSAGASSSFHHMLLELSTLDEVGFAYQRAKDAGAHIVIDLGRHVNDNMFSFYVLTPSGWAVEIGWGGIQIDDDNWHVTHYPTNSSWGHAFSMPPARVDTPA